MFIRSARTAIAVALLVLGSNAAVLAQSAPTPEPSALPEIGRVSTSDRQDEPLGATSRTTYVITKAEMLRKGLTTVAAALESVPGINVQHYGGLGALTDVGIRGSTSTQTLVLVDGRPIGGVQTGTVDLGSFLTTGIERIEVVEGGGATLYGANAVGGVVNILTQKNKSTVPTVRLRTGTYGEHAFAVDTRSFSFERTTIGNLFAYPAFGATPAGTRIDSDSEQTTARLNLGGTVGGLRAALTGGISSHHLGVAGDADFGLSPTTRQNSVDSDLRASLSRDSLQATTTLELSGTRAVLAYFNPFTDLNGPPFSDLNRETRLQVSLRNVVASERNRFVSGIDLARGNARIDAGDGNPPVHAFAQAAVYAQDSIALGSTLRVYGGLRAERDGSQGAAISPALGGTLTLAPGLLFKANYATAYRVPNAVDLYYPGFSNALLRPERTRGGDVTIADANVLGGASLGYFVQNGIDLIAPDSAFTTVINVARSSIAGFTGEIATRPMNGFVTKFNLTDTYRALDLTAAATRLPRRPVLSSNLDLSWSGSPLARIAGLGITAHSVGPRGTGADAYTRLDAYVRVRAAQHAIFSLRSYNLGNERYADVGGFAAPGRTFVLELSNH